MEPIVQMLKLAEPAWRSTLAFSALPDAPVRPYERARRRSRIGRRRR
jgi:hypothetical protein